ncbi:MAG: murein biosynthesis integral membrane protein MurJ [Myxococcota bacterium]
MSAARAEAGDTSEQRAITRRAGVVATGTLASRLLGAVRDAVIAATFAVTATDAFFVAFTIPNALRVLLGEGAASAAFVPVFSEVRAKEGHDRARRFFGAMTGAMAVVLLAVSVVGVVAAPALVTLYAAGYLDDPARFATTVQLTRMVFPYIFLMGLAALAVGALNAMKRFAVPAFAPALLNVALIAAPFVFVPVAVAMGLEPIAALAIGALVGGLLQVLAQLPALAGTGVLTWPRLGFRDPYVRKAFRLMVPLLAGLGVYQVNIMLSRLFASFLEPGAQSYLYYAQRLVEIPQGMFALAIASATLPTLSDLRNRGNDAEVRRVFRYGLRLSLFVAVPAGAALFVLAEPTVAVIFGRGEFEARQIAHTAHTLRWMALGIWAVASVRTVIPAFHAQNDTRTPVVASAVNLLVFVALSALLMFPMGPAGIAAAISTAAAVQLATLLGRLRRRTGPLGLKEVGVSLGRSLLASLVMGAALWGLARFGTWELGGNVARNVIVYVGCLVAGAAIYLGAAALLGSSELGDLLRAIRRRSRSPR